MLEFERTDQTNTLQRRIAGGCFRTFFVLLGLLFIPLAASCQPFPNTVIILENQKPGATDWLLTRPAANGEIEGFASLTSVNRGGQINLFVSTTNATFSLEVFRVGWYGGAGARELLGPLILNGSVQPPPVRVAATGLTECNWTNPFTLNIPATPGDPTDWATGVYLARLTGGQDGRQSYIIFVVRDDARPTDLLAQLSFTTYQAYNNWGGRSLYGFNSPGGQAQKVSFNRPFAYRGSGSAGAFWVGSGEFFFNSLGGAAYEANLVRWLEREGYDVAYCTSLDTHASAGQLLNHQGFLSMGHDEYWSYPMRWNVQAARDSEVNLAFLSSNTAFWQVRFEPSLLDGSPNRNMVCYKNLADPISATSSNRFTTVNFRSPPVNDPESILLGVSFTTVGPQCDLVVQNSNHWVFANTKVTPGQRLPGVVGYEVDATNAFSPANLQVACVSPFTLVDSAGNPSAQASEAASYTAASGATVFASGSMQWSWGLDDFNQPHIRESFGNPLAQQITRNVLARIINAPLPGPTFFFGSDVTTLGNWKPRFGADGWWLPNDSTNLPAYASFDPGGATSTTLLAASTDPSCLQQAAGNGRYLAGWSSPTNFCFDLNLSDGQNHQVAFYFWDWDQSGRQQRVEILDAVTTQLLDQRVLGNFTNGQWWSWQINGHVKIRFTNLAGPNCLVNAFAFGTGAAAAFVGEDPVTQGNWPSVYGSDGEYIIGDTSQPPAYGDVGIANATPTNWLASTADVRAPALSGSTNRNLAAWLGGYISSFHVGLRDNAWHQLALYCLDGDVRGRSQVISLFDSTTKSMLDSRAVTNFSGGKYLVWNIRGAVDVRIQNAGPASSAFSGIFFDPSNQPPVVSLTGLTNLQIFNLPGNISLNANATDGDSAIRAVKFYANGRLVGSASKAPYQFVWTNALVGAYQLVAEAVSIPFGRSTSTPVVIFVQPPAGYQNPVATVTSPTNTAAYPAFAGVTFSASVVSAAAITSVQFLVDGAPFGPPLTSAPFLVTTTNLFVGTHVIRAVVTDIYGVVITSPGSLISITGPTASAQFRKYDVEEQGTWQGIRGSDGGAIANNFTNLPAYALASVTGAGAVTLAAATGDARALQQPFATNRFLGAWTSPSNFLFDLNLQDGAVHRVAFYGSDWLRQGASETIQVLDAGTGYLLDSRSLTNFQKGVYLIWDLAGHVQLSFSTTTTNAPAQLSAVFFDPPRAQPQVVLVTPANGTAILASSDLQLAANAASGNTNLSRVDFLANGVTLGSAFAGPQYSVIWSNPPAGSYTVVARAVDGRGSNVLSSPVLVTVEPTVAAAVFGSTDTTHQGNWTGVYGGQGFALAGDRVAPPAYAALNLSSPTLTWASFTTDPRALQNGAGVVRTPAAWYAYTNVLLDVRCADPNFHRVTLYFLDWYNLYGVQTVDVLDAVSGTVLDEEVLPAFATGVYLGWDVKGHVQFRLTRNGISPVLISGIFFDASGILPAISITNPTAGSLFIVPTNIVITADASWDTNNVSRVDFYDGSTLLGSVSNQPPYAFCWTNAPLGSHSLTVSEVGPAGSAVSSSVSIFNTTSNYVGFLGPNLQSSGSIALDALAATVNTLRLDASFSAGTDAIWVPLLTNYSANHLFHFEVWDPTNYPQRYYRLTPMP